MSKCRELLERLRDAYREDEDGVPFFDGMKVPNLKAEIEAALAAPPEPQGDAAKMREALEKIDIIVWDKRRHTKEETEAHSIATEVLTEVHSTSSEPIGDNAKMREAMKAIKAKCETVLEIGPRLLVPYARDIIRCCEDALAAPPRNCDVGNAGEQTDRYVAFCNNTRCADCPCDKIDEDCELTWGQMPYPESEVAK
ncbi:MAG: hypothetical protein K6G94_01810 [Kiritimatiellae bacterium]|nr:hypothetical protein [Kiritimatiellia bacterium]